MSIVQAFAFVAIKLTHCILVDSSAVVCWMGSFVTFGGVGSYPTLSARVLSASSVCPDQMVWVFTVCLRSFCGFPGMNGLIYRCWENVKLDLLFAYTFQLSE